MRSEFVEETMTDDKSEKIVSGDKNRLLIPFNSASKDTPAEKFRTRNEGAWISEDDIPLSQIAENRSNNAQLEHSICVVECELKNKSTWTLGNNVSELPLIETWPNKTQLGNSTRTCVEECRREDKSVSVLEDIVPLSLLAEKLKNGTPVQKWKQKVKSVWVLEDNMPLSQLVEKWSNEIKLENITCIEQLEHEEETAWDSEDTVPLLRLAEKCSKKD